MWSESAIVRLLGLRFSLSLNREYFAAFPRILVPRHAYVLTFRLIRWWNANIFEVFFIVGFKWLQNKFFAYGLLLRNHNNIISNKNLFSFFHVKLGRKISIKNLFFRILSSHFQKKKKEISLGSVIFPKFFDISEITSLPLQLRNNTLPAKQGLK